jgi:hypothetical protein
MLVYKLMSNFSGSFYAFMKLCLKTRLCTRCLYTSFRAISVDRSMRSWNCVSRHACVPDACIQDPGQYSQNVHSVTSLLIVSKMWFSLMYVRFSHNVHSVICLPIVSEMWFLLMYVRFSHNVHFRNLLTYDFENVVFAYVSKVFGQFHFQNFLHRWCENVGVAYVRKVFAQFPFRNFIT